MDSSDYVLTRGLQHKQTVFLQRRERHIGASTCFSFRLSRIFCGTAAHYDRIAIQSSRSLGRVVEYTVRGTAFFHARHDIASSAICFGSRLEDENCGENFQVHLRPKPLSPFALLTATAKCWARYETGWNKLWEGSPGDKPHLRYNFEVLVRIDHASGALLFARE